jgi:hypothetical protein
MTSCQSSNTNSGWIVGLGAVGYISSEDVFKFLRKRIAGKTLQLFVSNSKRLGGLHSVRALF